MNILLRTLLVAPFLLLAVGCQKPPPAAPVQATLAVPADANDSNAWKKYLAERASRYMKENKKGSGRLYAYFLPMGGDHSEILNTVQNTLSRGVLAGTVLLFGSPDSNVTSEFISKSFTGVPAKSLAGVTVMFVGAAADKDRVAAMIEPSGVTYVFLEAK